MNKLHNFTISTQQLNAALPVLFFALGLAVLFCTYAVWTCLSPRTKYKVWLVTHLFWKEEGGPWTAVSNSKKVAVLRDGKFDVLDSDEYWRQVHKYQSN